MNFLDTWQELEELYQAEFKNGPEDKYYHFFYDISDLINSLSIGRIYSNKNLRAAQLDVYERDKAYICTTKGSEGKERAVTKFNRPIGISFINLPELCIYKGYSFAEENPYSQFLAKTQYSIGTTGSKSATPIDSDKLVAAFRDFRLLAIGELDGDFAGKYFISGGQGRNLTNHWYSRIFEDKQLYDTLKRWFSTNMNSTDGSSQPTMYYHFRDNFIGKPTEEFLGKPINTTGQLNQKYKPWVDPLKGTKKQITHNMAMDFTLHFERNGGSFKEIIGIGPFKVEDIDGKTLLQMDLCKSGPGGYPAPALMSTGPDGTFSDVNKIVSGRGKKSKDSDAASIQKHLMLDKDTATAIAELYNEAEYRVYMPNRKDFTFSAKDISSLVLPRVIGFDNKKVLLDIEALIKVLGCGSSASRTFATKDTTFAQELIAEKILNTASMDVGTLKLIQKFVELLQTKYFHTTIELTAGDADVSHTKSTTYNKTGGVDDAVDLDTLKGGDKTRYLISDNVKIAWAQTVLWHGVESVVARVSALKAKARIGSETILIGKDKDNNKYVLFVDNSYKATGFFELPGGGLHSIDQINPAGFETIAKQRLYFKGGLNTDNHIKNFAPTGKALVLQEKGVAKDKGVTWPWSYYKLFTAFYNQEILVDDIDYSFDNRSTPKEIRAKGEDGYICTLRWVPVESLDLNRSIKDRYSNIIPFIKAEADKY